MRFMCFEPTSVEEAVSLLAKYNGNAKLLAGGTDLIVQMRQCKMAPEYVISIMGIKELDYIRYNDGGDLRIGALTNVRDLEMSKEIGGGHGVIREAAGCVASTGIRNMATIGGNLCNASPAADMAPCLIALSAEIKIVGDHGERQVSLEDFFQGPGSTALGKSDLLTEVVVPAGTSRTGAVYLKHGVRTANDLSVAGVAASVTLEKGSDIIGEIKLALGAVGPTAMRAKNAEAVLRGKQPTKKLIQETALIASEEAQPITDIRASSAYRKEMVRVFTEHAIQDALQKAQKA